MTDQLEDNGLWPPTRPRIVCLCGSTRFYDLFREANFRLTLAGEIVLSIGCDTKSDAYLHITDDDKIRLDELHRHKIALADWVFVVSDESGYFGPSTAGEIAHAEKLGKPVQFMTPEARERAVARGLVQ